MWDILLILSELSTTMCEIETHFKEFQTSITLFILTNRAICERKGKKQKIWLFHMRVFPVIFWLGYNCLSLNLNNVENNTKRL